MCNIGCYLNKCNILFNYKGDKQAEVVVPLVCLQSSSHQGHPYYLDLSEYGLDEVGRAGNSSGPVPDDRYGGLSEGVW